MRDELVDLEVAVHVVGDETGELRAALDAAERAAFPYAAGDELEGCWEELVRELWVGGGEDRVRTPRADLLAGGGDTNDDALAPALVAGLEGGTHDVDVASAVESVVAAAVGHLDELLLDALGAELGGVHKVGGAKFLGPLLLGVVDVDDDDAAGLVLDGALDDAEPDAAGTEDGHVGALLESTLAGGDDGGAVARGDAAAQQAGAVHGSLVGDGNDGDVGHDGVLREGRGAHEVEEVLALGLEARGAVGHDALALGGANLAAKVGLARLAELALATLGGAGAVSGVIPAARGEERRAY